MRAYRRAHSRSTETRSPVAGSSPSSGGSSSWTMSPLNPDAPVESVISTLWGTASLLLNEIVNAVSAGAVTAVCSYAMFIAEISTAWPAPLPDGAADPPEGAADPPDACALPDG